MTVYLANKTRFRADILSNRIEEIVHVSFQAKLGKFLGPSELTSWKNSLRHMDTVLEDILESRTLAFLLKTMASLPAAISFRNLPRHRETKPGGQERVTDTARLAKRLLENVMCR